MFVGGHDADAIGVEVYESVDGDLGLLVLGEVVEKATGRDVWIALCLMGC